MILKTCVQLWAQNQGLYMCSCVPALPSRLLEKQKQNCCINSDIN